MLVAKYAPNLSQDGLGAFAFLIMLEVVVGMMMPEQEWEKFVQSQRRTASGNRLERLKKNLVGEKKMFKEALWPVFRSFEGFSLEYEVKSLSGVHIYLDAFYHPLKIAFESEGFVPHAETITRDRFSFERMRIRTMAYLGYKFVPFTWDELDQHPEMCRRTVYELLGRYSGKDDRAYRELTVYEQEVLRYA